VVDRVIQACPIDMRRALYGNIVLSVRARCRFAPSRARCRSSRPPRALLRFQPALGAPAF